MGHFSLCARFASARRGRIVGKNILENSNTTYVRYCNSLKFRTATQINAKLSIWNRVVFPFGAQRREEKGGKTLEMDLTSSGEGIYRDAPFPKITRAELLPDGKRDELRDFPRGSNRKSVFW